MFVVVHRADKHLSFALTIISRLTLGDQDESTYIHHLSSPFPYNFKMYSSRMPVDMKIDKNEFCFLPAI